MGNDRGEQWDHWEHGNTLPQLFLHASLAELSRPFPGLRTLRSIQEVAFVPFMGLEGRKEVKLV